MESYCGGLGTRWRERVESGLEQVAKEHLITFTLADYPEHQAWIAGLFAPLNRSPQIVEELDSITSLIAAVESGRGVINVKVPYFLVAELAPLMAKRGKGAIINLSTMVADYGAAGMALYGSSKSAIKLLTKAWAAEYGPSGVRVNAVSPGPIETAALEKAGLPPEMLEQAIAGFTSQVPLGRRGKPEEIAASVVFLASDESSYITGVELAVAGGMAQL